MNMKKRVMSGVLGAALALTGFAGVTAPAMAVVGNGSYINAAKNLTWASAYNTAGNNGYARAEVGRIVNGKKVVYYSNFHTVLAFHSIAIRMER